MSKLDENSRNLSLDLTRTVAILLVTVLHAWSMLDINNDSYGWIFYVYRSIVHCGVPLFVMISGALLLQQPCSAKLFFAKRFARVLIPFLFWAVPVYIIGVLTHRYNSIQSFGDACLYFFPYLLQNDIQMYQWFVHMILTLYLLTPLLQRALTLSSKHLVLTYLAGWALVLILQHLYPDIYALRYVSPLFYFLGIYIAGYYIYRYISNNSRVWVGAGIAWIAVCTINIALKTRYSCVDAFATLCLFTFLSKIPISQQSAIRTGILSMSRYSYTIYLIHVPLISALYQLLDKFTNGAYTQWATPVMSVLPIGAAAIVLAICYIACLIADKCRYINNNLLGISK